MVVGRLLILSLCISLTACGTPTRTYISDSVGSSANTSYSPNTSYISIVSNFAKWKSYKLPVEDQLLQEQAVFFALNNLQNGETTRWYNGNTGAQGAVRVAMTYPQGSGYCRVIMSQIFYNGKQRDFKETACVNAVDNSWRFIR